jgi:hypothetical protein
MPASESAQSVQRFTEIWDKGRPRDRQRNNGDTPTARCCGPANGRSSPARGEGGFGGERVRRRRCSRPPRTRCRGAITPATAGAAVAVVRRPQSAAPIPIRCGGRFPRTILHGLCTYGIGRKAIVDTFLEGDVSRLCPSGARFASVLFPTRRCGPASGRRTTSCWRQHHHNAEPRRRMLLSAVELVTA